MHALKNKHLAKMDGFVSIMSMVVLIWYLNAVRVCVGFGILCACDLIEMKHPKASSASLRRCDECLALIPFTCCLVHSAAVSRTIFSRFHVHVQRRAYFAWILLSLWFLFVSLVVRSLSTIHLLGIYVFAKRDCGVSKICLSMSNL